MELRYKFTLILFSSGDHGCHCSCDMAVYMCKVLCILQILVDFGVLVLEGPMLAFLCVCQYVEFPVHPCSCL